MIATISNSMISINASSSFISAGNALFTKIKTIAYPAFLALSGSYYGAFGSVEILQSVIQQEKEINAINKDQANNVVLKSSSSFLRVHGLMMVGTGICTGLEYLNTVGLAIYGKWMSSIFTTGSILFLFANVAGLEENVRIYDAINKMEQDGVELDKKKQWTKVAAFWGVISCLSYIVATSVMLFGGSAGLTLAIGIIGTFTGAIKVISDFVAWVVNK